VRYTLAEIREIIDEKYLPYFSEPFTYDESTLRKKLKEYEGEGIIVSERSGKKTLYRRTESVDVAPLADALDFFSEASPCGVIGSFLLDKIESDELFTFKHHYITGAIDSGVMAALFSAMREGRAVSVDNLNHKREEPRRTSVLPLRIFISTQSGRQHLLAYQYGGKCFVSLRLDYLSRVKLEGVDPRFAELREMLDDAETKMWGVNIKRGKFGDYLESVSFVVKINPGEEYIVKRLEREKRIGRVEKLDDRTYRFSAEVYDTWEMVPWIRTFISRIESMNFSNRTVENRFKDDIREMYRMYGIDGEVAE
jgi:DNA-binding transcriptional ArsR family regulator